MISRLTAEWKDEYDRWQKRDLSARRYVYVWADGVYLQARMEDNAECMLVLIGATPEGKKELIGFRVGARESAQSWRELLVEVKQRGLKIAPEIAVGDGALGFWKAIDEVFPGTRHQRCWVHKMANVLNKVALSVQANMKKDLCRRLRCRQSRGQVAVTTPSPVFSQELVCRTKLSVSGPAAGPVGCFYIEIGENWLIEEFPDQSSRELERLGVIGQTPLRLISAYFCFLSHLPPH